MADSCLPGVTPLPSLSLVQTGLGQGYRPVLVIVEGVHDIAFLQGMSRILHAQETDCPDLHAWEATGRVVFLPSGGDPALWAHRLARLPFAEFHLYDREVPPVTAQRHTIVAAINQRPGCIARLTNTRSVENLLAPDAIFDACGVRLAYDASSDVPVLLARQLLAATPAPPWDLLSRRIRTRWRNRAKLLLNTVAVGRMTPARLTQQDPHGEVRDWLASIARLAEDTGR